MQCKDSLLYLKSTKQQFRHWTYHFLFDILSEKKTLKYLANATYQVPNYKKLPKKSRNIRKCFGKWYNYDIKSRTGPNFDILSKEKWNNCGNFDRRPWNFFFLLQVTILAALKLTRAKAQNIIFVAEKWEKKLNIINVEIWENNAEIWSFPRASYSYVIEDPTTRTPQGALKFVALIIKILSCNKKKKFMVYDQNYHNCSTLVKKLYKKYHYPGKIDIMIVW
jgi:hypothetical protein